MKICVVCASNQNRSMEAHYVLNKRGFQVCSFGTNSLIKLPGLTPDKPNSYPFGTTYESIANDLLSKDPTLYRQNGMLMLLERNKAIKSCPQRFQDRKNISDDLVITCEERCFDIVSEDLLQRTTDSSKIVHLVNFDIIDNPEEATVGAKSILQFIQTIKERQEENEELSLHDIIPKVYEEFCLGSNINLKTLYSVHFVD